MMTSLLPALLSATLALSPKQGTPPFRSSVEMVTVNVAVTDRKRPVAGLGASDFELLDNGVPQEFLAIDATQGINLVLVLDISGSVRGSLFTHLANAVQGVVGALRPSDRVSLITFSERIDSTGSGKTAVMNALARLSAGHVAGRTALYDAVYAGLASALNTPLQRCLLLVFTDGADNASWLGHAQVVEALRRNNAVLYVVARRDLATPLDQVALDTGGRVYPANLDKRLTSTFVDILNTYRSSYLLAFTPKAVGNGDGWHQLTVRLRGRRGEVRARPGYLSR